MTIEFKRFRVTSASAGSVEVFLNSQLCRWYAECRDDQDRHNFVAHEAWKLLWEHDSKRMLKNLCDTLGVQVVQKTFYSQIQIEEIDT